MAEPPSIVDGPTLEVRKAVEYDMPCPKCRMEIRVTELKVGTVLKCPHGRCGNVTWRPEYVPPWWAKPSKFILSLIISFILGVIGSMTASFLYEKHFNSRDVIPKTNTTNE